MTSTRSGVVTVPGGITVHKRRPHGR